MATVERISKKKIRRRKKMTKGDRIFSVFVWGFFILVSLLIVYPLLHMIALSFSGKYDLAHSGGLYLIPGNPTLENYKEFLFNRINVPQAFLVTTARTVLGTITALLANAFLAYILSRKKFLFKSGLSLFWIFTMYAAAGYIPTIVLFMRLHLTNSFWVYIIPGMVSAFHVLVIKTYMENIPDSLEESAQLEGAGHLKIFWNIVSPICKPVYATIAFFIAVSHWNSWFDAFLFNRMAQKYTTLQFEIMKYLTSIFSAQTGTISRNAVVIEEVHRPAVQALIPAACILTMLPVIILYPFFQKHFINGLRIRGVKD